MLANFRLPVFVILLGSMLGSCTSMDMDSMPQTYRYDGHEEERYQTQLNAREEYDARFHGQAPYDYYRSKGYSDQDARRYANQAGPRP